MTKNSHDRTKQRQKKRTSPSSHLRVREDENVVAAHLGGGGVGKTSKDRGVVRAPPELLESPPREDAKRPQGSPVYEDWRPCSKVNQNNENRPRNHPPHRSSKDKKETLICQHETSFVCTNA